MPPITAGLREDDEDAGGGDEAVEEEDEDLVVVVRSASGFVASLVRVDGEVPAVEPPEAVGFVVGFVGVPVPVESCQPVNSPLHSLLVRSFSWR